MKPRRTLKPLPLGKHPRSKVRAVVRGIHVAPTLGGRWEVRTLGPSRVRLGFESKEAAVRHAQEMSPEGLQGVFIHETGPPRRSQRRNAQ